MDAVKNVVPDAGPTQDSWMVQTVVARLVIWGSAAVSLAVYWWIGNGFAVPLEKGYSATLLEASGLANLLVVTVAYLAIAAGASVTLGRFRRGIGLWAAAFGLAAISARGGTVSDFLRHGNSYGLLLVETVLLGVLAVAGLVVARVLSHQHPVLHIDDEPPTLQNKLLSVGLQTGVTIVLIWILCQTDMKGQALAAVGAASVIGTLAADNVIPVGMTPMAVIAPFVVAVIAYVWAMLSGHGLEPANPLARALPLDYASFGVAGTVMGHWISQQWREEAEGE